MERIQSWQDPMLEHQIKSSGLPYLGGIADVEVVAECNDIDEQDYVQVVVTWLQCNT